MLEDDDWGSVDDLLTSRAWSLAHETRICMWPIVNTAEIAPTSEWSSPTAAPMTMRRT
jgi:hypothetical protein